MYYLRKIEIKRWNGRPDGDSDSVSDLVTSNHELSVWEVDEDLSNLSDMALATALTKDKLEELCFVLLRREEIEAQYGWNVPLEAQDGVTGFDSQKQRHKNFMLHTISDMGQLASYIHAIIKSEDMDRIKVISEQDLLKMLAKKFRSGEIDENKLKVKFGKWRKEANKLIEKEKAQTSAGQTPV